MGHGTCPPVPHKLSPAPVRHQNPVFPGISRIGVNIYPTGHLFPLFRQYGPHFSHIKAFASLTVIIFQQVERSQQVITDRFHYLTFDYSVPIYQSRITFGQMVKQALRFTACYAAYPAVQKSF